MLMSFSQILLQYMNKTKSINFLTLVLKLFDKLFDSFIYKEVMQCAF